MNRSAVPFVAALVSVAHVVSSAQPGKASASEQPLWPLDAAFVKPPPQTRPGCYWYWISDNVSKEGITKDLEAMARVGIGRAYIGHVFGQNDRWQTPPGDVKFMSEAWWEALQWAVKEADRCGVEIGFFNSPGWSQSGGPWLKPSQSMRYLDASETVVEGGRQLNQVLPVPEIKTFPMAGGSKPEATGPMFTEKDFQDVRVIAFRQPETEANDTVMAHVKVDSPTLKPLDALLDGSSKTSVKIGPKAQLVDFHRDDSQTVQSLRIVPLDQLYTLTCAVAVSDDGRKFREIARHVEQRGHQGPRNKDPLLIPLPETKARHLRVTLSASREIPIAELSLSRRAVLAYTVRKQLGETSPSVRPPWDAYVWEAQPAPAAGSAVASADVLDLTDKMDAAGRLVWDAPPGRWVVLRLGMVPIGTQCHPTSPESRGLEVDKMSRQHVRSLFDGMVGEFIRRTPPADRKALKYLIADSYETGPQNWTDGMIERFSNRFSYSPVRFLPCLSGRVVDSPEVSTRFLWDWRRLVAETIASEYVGGLREIAHENGLILWLENYGHWGFPSEFLLYGSKSDQVGGEFWEDGDPLGEVECRAAASCSHIYGRADAYAEAFTSSRSFTQSPASLKTWCDWAFGAGINHFILHVYIHQPDERKPGITAWFGTPFNRHNTWFEPSKAFMDYTRRSSVLLKAGRPVVDVAYYIGENAPAMQGPRDPVLPDGYDFDYINSDVLINRAAVWDGRIVLTNGPSYAVLVLPKQGVMRPEVAEALRRLVHEGACVVGSKPVASPSLAGYPACDRTVSAIAQEVWGSVDGSTVKTHHFGKGAVHHGVTLETVFAERGVQPDVRVVSETPLRCAAATGGGTVGIGEKGGIVFKHRVAPRHEIFFIANTGDKPAVFTASLRIAGREPQLWNAVTGAISDVPAFTQRNGRTEIPLTLAASESVFVVFGEAIGPEVSGTGTSNALSFETVATLDGPWTVRFQGEGAPAETRFETLSDWSKHPDEAVRHYAGTAAYQTTFTLAESLQDKRVVLELGRVGVIASVEVNGREAGIVWSAPWTCDISGLAKVGSNTLVIRVTNTWNNRLVADMALPPEKRLTYASHPSIPKAKASLQEGGLLGPVRVKASQGDKSPARGTGNKPKE